MYRLSGKSQGIEKGCVVWDWLSIIKTPSLPEEKKAKLQFGQQQSYVTGGKIVSSGQRMTGTHFAAFEVSL